jgi:uncharacterized protein (TIGR03435 family)
MFLGKRNRASAARKSALGFAAAALPLLFLLPSAGQLPPQSPPQNHPRSRTVPASGKPLKFEVVSIRQNKNTGMGDCHQKLGAATPDGYRMSCMWMLIPIMQAYSTQKSGGNTVDTSNLKFVGFPPWLGQDRYDIDARVAPEDLKNWQNPNLRPAMMRAMLRSMLKDRLQLVVHHGTQIQSVYLLQVGKDGPKFKPTVPGEKPAASPYQMRLPGGGENVLLRQGSEIIHHEYGITMAQLARGFPHPGGRTVIDDTGLKGRYDITYGEPFTLHPAGNGPPHSPPPGPGRSASAIAHSLGLKLVPAKRSVPTLVCGHIERPTPN